MAIHVYVPVYKCSYMAHDVVAFPFLFSGGKIEAEKSNRLLQVSMYDQLGFRTQVNSV